MGTVDALQCKIRLYAGEIANLHWMLDQFYEHNEIDPRIPSIVDALNAKLETHHNALKQLERVKCAQERSLFEERHYLDFIRAKCAKVHQRSQ
tara:strand:- start:8425 stop:8703 length:279 start_codon:yes stop_codon:yes gene_type:complete